MLGPASLSPSMKTTCRTEGGGSVMTKKPASWRERRESLWAPLTFPTSIAREKTQREKETLSVTHTLWALAAGQKAAFTVEAEKKKRKLFWVASVICFISTRGRQEEELELGEDKKKPQCPTLCWGESPANRVYKTWWGMWSIFFFFWFLFVSVVHTQK